MRSQLRIPGDLPRLLSALCLSLWSGVLHAPTHAHPRCPGWTLFTQGIDEHESTPESSDGIVGLNVILCFDLAVAVSRLRRAAS